MTAVDYRLEQLAAQLESLREQLADRTPQLGYSSMEGSIGEYVSTPDGDQLVARYGTQFDGTHTAVSLAGPVPPTPTGYEAMSIPTGIAVRWDGSWVPLPAPDGEMVPTPVVAPSDFRRAEVHVSTDPDQAGILFTTYRGAIESTRGGEVQILGLQPDTDHWIRLTVRTESGKFSPAGEAIGPIRAGKVGESDLGIDLASIGGNTISRGPDQPAGPNKIGDLWLQTPGNVPHRWEGDPDGWVESRDTGIATAIQQAFEAQATADGRTQLFTQGANPGPLAADGSGIWINTGENNAIYNWDGADWVPKLIGNSAIQPGSLVASDVIATGTVSAALLEAIMVLATAIIGGDPTGNHVRVDSLGLRIFSIDPDGQVVESGRWGTGGGDRVLIMKNDRPVASIDQDGGGSFTSLNVDGDITMGGRTLNYLFDGRPRGLVVRAGIETVAPATTTALGAFDVEFTAVPGRAYRIYTSTLNLNPSTTSTYGYASLICRPSAEGPPSLNTGLTIVRGNGSANIAGGIEPFTLQRVCSFAELFPDKTPPNGQVPTKVRLLLAYGVSSGGGSISLFGGTVYPIHVYVEDVGPEQWFTGVANNGSGSTAAPLVQYVTNWAATWGANWQSNSNARRTDQVELIQGYTPYYPAGGIGIGQIGFDVGYRADGTQVGTFQQELTGATIQQAAIFLYSTHWMNDSGGTVLLGGHPYANVPATKPTDWQLLLVGSAGHPKPGGKWIYLPSSLYADLANGVTKGFTLGDAASTIGEYYGRFAVDPTDSRRPVVQIVYTK